uniref:Transposase, IS605 OrfB n=1 Tax=Bacillus thuringiensis TaxID=1428 RepID=A0A1B2RBW2_BACTU|nr:Transposase, IS605 OrfB [Bacillus thuringiensis]
MASNKGWKGAILIVRHTESVTPLSIEYTFGLSWSYTEMEVNQMMINKAYKFRIYPNQAQSILINKTIDCSRFVFNHFLSLWDHAYKETGKGLTYGTCSAKLPAMKKEFVWLKEVDSIAIQSSVRNLADAYTRFKSKKNNVQSYTTKQTNENIDIIGDKIRLPKLGLV